jgi:hypothetical protein
VTSRDYRPLLEAAQELQFFTGYLDTQGLKEQGKAQGIFNAERRKFVYERLKDSGDPEAAIASVSADLDRIAETNTDYTPGAIEEVRSQLIEHIRRQASNGPFMRFIVRWGPPALITAATVGYFVLRFYQ